MSEEKVKELSRRKFLHGAGASVAGFALAGTVGMMLSGCSKSEGSAAPPAAPPAVAPAEPAVAEWPYTYKKLDPDVAAQKGYDGYKADG
jgi:hypothetical protein